MNAMRYCISSESCSRRSEHLSEIKNQQASEGVGGRVLFVILINSLFLFSIVINILNTVSIASEQTYRLINIDTLIERAIGGATTFSRAWDINNNQQVVGYVDYVDPSQGSRHAPFFYDHNNGLLLVGTGSGEFRSINDKEIIAGWEITAQAQTGATVSGVVSGALSTVRVGGVNDPSKALSINNKIWVAGSETPSSFFLQNFFKIDIDKFSIPLSSLGSEITALNNINGIVGTETTTAGIFGFYVGPVGGSTNSFIIKMGTLGGTTSIPSSINDSGFIVGESGNQSFFGVTRHAFITHSDSNGVLQDLGTLGGSESFAYDINNKNIIVGKANNFQNIQEAFIYQDEVMTSLNSRVVNIDGWLLEEARAINDDGVIIAQGFINGSRLRTYAVLLIPNIENSKPVVTTIAISSIGSNDATASGNITSLGIPSASKHGVCWNISSNPTTSDTCTQLGRVQASGSFTSLITGLDPGTKYYVRAYATNSIGTTYGSQVSFLAKPLSIIPWLMFLLD